MFYPAFENDAIAIVKYDEDNIQEVPVHGYGNDRYVYTNEVEIFNYIGQLEHDYNEYYFESSFEFKTLREAQTTLIGWVMI